MANFLLFSAAVNETYFFATETAKSPAACDLLNSRPTNASSGYFFSLLFFLHEKSSYAIWSLAHAWYIFLNLAQGTE